MKKDVRLGLSQSIQNDQSFLKKLFEKTKSNFKSKLFTIYKNKFPPTNEFQIFKIVAYKI